jgi:hypothetical protein
MTHPLIIEIMGVIDAATSTREGWLEHNNAAIVD